MSPEKADVVFQNLLMKKDATIEDLLETRKSVYTSKAAQMEFSKTLADLEADKTGKDEVPKKLGVALWMTGRLDEAEKLLTDLTDTPSRYFAAQCMMSNNRHAEARESLEKIPAKQRPPQVEAAIGRTIRLGGKPDDALDHMRGIASKGKNADILCELGLCLYENGEYDAAVEALEEAIQIEPEHAEALFNLAYLLYQRGANQKAMELYQKCISLKPVHAGAIANLALIYEDMGMYEEGAAWMKKLHEANPSDDKIDMLSRFSSSCTAMYYDDERQRQAARREKLLAMPIDDFELSIRSRKCLAEMTIQTLGDLVSKTEAELLSFNNFGETSLTEVKSILKQKGLTLKEEAPIVGESTPSGTAPIPKDEVLDLSLEEAGLSTRVRKCLESRRIKTLRDVIDKGEKNLLEIRDFGRASLRELKRRLTYYDLSLKEE
jgi:DNA-directed RNA polymerase subunit alpha